MRKDSSNATGRSSIAFFHPTEIRPGAVVRRTALVLGLFVLMLAGRGLAPKAIDPVAAAPWDGALLITPSSLEDQAARADYVVVGRITGQASHNVPGSIDTDVTVSLEKAAKGPTVSAMTFTVPGGRVGDRQVFVGGEPNFLTGERVLLFLRRPHAGETAPHLVQMWQSKYTLAGANAVQAESAALTPIPQVEQRLSTVLGKGISIGTTTNTVTAQPFTVSCSPWKSSQMPVPYRVNGTSGTTIMPESSFVSFTANAINAWTSQSGTSIKESFAGTGGDATNHGDGVNTVAWGDVSGLGSGVIGANYCTESAGTRIDSDTLISNAYSWDADPSNGIDSGSLSLYSVMVHELGHGIGIGHPCESSDGICSFSGSGGRCDTGPNTPVMCPVISFGVNKTIQQDDHDAVVSLYPGTGGTGTPRPAGNLESPPAGNVGQSFTVSGWAIDQGAASGTGVDLVHIYAYPASSNGAIIGAAQFLGQASYGGARPDIVTATGSTQFLNSGFTYQATNVAVGTYQLTAYYHSTVNNAWSVLQHLITVTGPTTSPAGVIESPPAGNVAQNFTVSGWAVDAGATGSTTGIDLVHVYVYPTNSAGTVTGAAQFLGQASYGAARPDIATAFKSTRFTNSGFSLAVSNLAKGNYQLTVFMHSTISNAWTPLTRLINVTGPVSTPVMFMDQPTAGATVGATFTVSGWAIDTGAPSGTGVDLVHVYAYPSDASGNITGQPVFLGQASYGGSRPDVANAFKSTQFTNSGYTLSAGGLTTGNYVLAVYAHSTVSGNWNALTRLIKR